MRRQALAALVALFAAFSTVKAQAMKPLPYNAQLRTDPVVGNVQGIQRYGRSMRTDPDEGEGYSYHVYPVADKSPAAIILADGAYQNQARQQLCVEAGADFFAARSKADKRLADRFAMLSPEEKSTIEAALRRKSLLGQQTQLDLQTFLLLGKTEPALAESDPIVRSIFSEYQRAVARLHSDPCSFQCAAAPPMCLTQIQTPYSASPYPSPFDATAGLRNPSVQAWSSPNAAGSNVQAFASYDPKNPATPLEINHQPLIQIRVRVIEVDRSSALQATSILETITNPGKKTQFTSNNVNNNNRGFYAGTRFPQLTTPSLINIPANAMSQTPAALTGPGAFLNLTINNLNYLAELLANDFRADVVTAPEVITLNGQNVEFVSGDKVPFALGQTTVSGNAANTQQVFYKHVGTFVSITPHIVNWGPLGDGAGAAPLVDADIPDWHGFVVMLDCLQCQGKINVDYKDFAPLIHDYLKQPLAVLPLDAKSQILTSLKRYSKADLIALGLPIAEVNSCGRGCGWHAEDCTVDLQTVIRLSEGGTVSFPPQAMPGGAAGATVTAETNVRGIANVVQVKSGCGVVMAGLIGNRDVKQVDKIPVLGDIPVVGSLFRSTQTQKQKTEILIFIEARVLDPDSDVARAKSHEDFLLGKQYVTGDFLDNPLEIGMRRAGFGRYLPPCGAAEKVFWEQWGRNVRRVTTELSDIYK